MTGQSQFAFQAPERDRVDADRLREMCADNFERRSSDAQGTALKGAHPISGQRASARPRRRPFTPAQARREGAKRKPTQCDRILALLETGKWVSLPQILALGVAQYNARIWELRNRYGLVIECETREVEGQTHSWYRLVRE